MAHIVVVGAGLCGLAVAALLAEDGHEVTVLERDPQPAPVGFQKSARAHDQQ